MKSKITEVYDLSIDNKQIDAFNKIIYKQLNHWIKAFNLKSLNYDDLYQDCWLKIIERAYKSGEYPDYGVVKEMVHDIVIQYIRKGTRTDHSTFSDIIDDETGEDHNKYNIDPEQVTYDLPEYKDLLAMFPKGSKERKFIEFYAEKAKLGDFGFHPKEFTDSGKAIKDDGFTKSELAQQLGYKGTDDHAFQKFYDRMFKFIKDYYGWTDDQ